MVTGSSFHPGSPPTYGSVSWAGQWAAHSPALGALQVGLASRAEKGSLSCLISGDRDTLSPGEPEQRTLQGCPRGCHLQLCGAQEEGQFQGVRRKTPLWPPHLTPRSQPCRGPGSVCRPLLSVYGRDGSSVGDTGGRVRVEVTSHLVLLQHVAGRPWEEGRVPGGQSHPDTGSSQLLIT